MHTVSYEFLIKPKESAGCHQTLSSLVGSGHETREEVALMCHKTKHMILEDYHNYTYKGRCAIV